MSPASTDAVDPMDVMPRQTMRAASLPAPGPIETGPLVLTDVPLPEPGPGEVLVRVRACGVCRTDLHVAEGDLTPRRVPVIPGHQIVGEIAALGPSPEGDGWLGRRDLALGQRVGVAWLRQTCGSCRSCGRGRENLCENARFTGWTDDGGFAEYAVAPAAYVYPLPLGFSDHAAAPLLCAGIIGYRALRLTGITDWPGVRLGLYGFGAAGHVVIQLARGRGAEVYVATRDRERHQALAAELGAAWVGGTLETPPVPLDAAIIFAPAGELVPAALSALDRGATLVLGGIHMSPIPELPYALLYGERIVRTVANNTREDGEEFLVEAARLPVRTHTELFPLARANEALRALKQDAIRGAAVLLPFPTMGDVQRSEA